MFISEKFDVRTIASMEAALEAACRSLPARLINEHEARKFIGTKILECTENGGGTLKAFTEAAQKAASEHVTKIA